jgi:hypothetical protein
MQRKVDDPGEPQKYVVVSGHAQQPSLVAIKAVVDAAKTIHPEAF